MLIKVVGFAITRTTTKGKAMKKAAKKTTGQNEQSQPGALGGVFGHSVTNWRKAGARDVPARRRVDNTRRMENF